MATVTSPPPATAHKPLNDPDRPPHPFIPAALLFVFLVLAGGAAVWLYFTIVRITAAGDKETQLVFLRFTDPVGPLSFFQVVGHWAFGLWAFGVLLLAAIAGGLMIGRKPAGGWWTAAALVGGVGGAMIFARVVAGFYPSTVWSGGFWLTVLFGTLLVAFIYVAWMYVRDSRSVGWMWAIFLGVLRCSVYVILAMMFLKPALQSWERSETFSKVIVIFDVSGSMGQADKPPTDAVPNPPTRLDQVRDLLAAKDGVFAKKILEKNPITLYQFGQRLDEEFRELKKGEAPWTDAHWAAWMMMDFKEWALDGLSPEGKELVVRMEGFSADQPGTAAWAGEWFPKFKAPEGLNESDKTLLEKKKGQLSKRLELRQQIMGGTNYGESVSGVVDREANNSLAAIIVVGDGQSNLGSNAALEDVRKRAEGLKVPIFTIGVGEVREQVRIQVTEIAAPDQAPPDERFPIRVTVEGEGMADKDVRVFVDFYKKAPADVKPGEKSTEKPNVTMEGVGKFKATASGPTPVATVDFLVDPNAETLGDLRVLNPETGKYELTPGEWTLVARVKSDEREIFVGKMHFSEKKGVNVVKRPLRVLLVAGGPTRDYQFLRRLFVNETDKGRAQMSIYLQTTTEGTDRVQDVPADRLLKQFPDKLVDLKGADTDGDYSNLANYDVIVAFDPDWELVPPAALENLQRWVETQAGGLIFVAGPINTYKLTAKAKEKDFRPLLDLLPIRPENDKIAGAEMSRQTDPHRLHFGGATKETEFLKLNEEGKEVIAGWEEFFSNQLKAPEGAETKPSRGFYECYPSASVKPSAKVIASFVGMTAATSPDQPLSSREPPYLVTLKNKGNIVFLASGEMWRLRLFREVFHERFWTELTRYAAAGRLDKGFTRRGSINMGSRFTAGKAVPINVELLGEDFKPMAQKTKVTARIIPPAGVKLGKEDSKDGVLELELAPRLAGTWAGQFDGRAKFDVPGDYQIKIDIAGQPGNLVSPHNFTVKESNPELDDLRPNFALLYELAGKVSELQGTDGQKEDLRRKLQKVARPERDDKTATSDPLAKEQEPRLFFDLATASVIPDYLIERHDVQRNRGPIRDLWDEGLTPRQMEAGLRWGVRGAFGWLPNALMLPEGMHLSAEPIFPTTKDPDTSRLSTAMFLVIGLLSVEWLTRKLLKLA